MFKPNFKDEYAFSEELFALEKGKTKFQASVSWSSNIELKLDVNV